MARTPFLPVLVTLLIVSSGVFVAIPTVSAVSEKGAVTDIVAGSTVDSTRNVSFTVQDDSAGTDAEERRSEDRLAHDETALSLTVTNNNESKSVTVVSAAWQGDYTSRHWDVGDKLLSGQSYSYSFGSDYGERFGPVGTLNVTYSVDGATYTESISVDMDHDDDGMFDNADYFPTQVPVQAATIPINASKGTPTSVTVTFENTSEADAVHIYTYHTDGYVPTGANDVREKFYAWANSSNNTADPTVEFVSTYWHDQAAYPGDVYTRVDDWSEYHRTEFSVDLQSDSPNQYAYADGNQLVVMTHGSAPPPVSVELVYDSGETTTTTPTTTSTSTDGSDGDGAGSGSGPTSIEDVLSGSVLGVPTALWLILAVVAGLFVWDRSRRHDQ